MLEYSVVIQYDKRDGIFVAAVPELPGCMAHGDTPEKALEEIKIAQELWIESAKSDGLQIPEPVFDSSLLGIE